MKTRLGLKINKFFRRINMPELSPKLSEIQGLINEINAKLDKIDNVSKELRASVISVSRQHPKEDSPPEGRDRANYSPLGLQLEQICEKLDNNFEYLRDIIDDIQL
jgi:hypothetical protein